MSRWNDDNTELAKKLWNEGLSASQIASRIGGMSRNAVIGKVHRMGLAGRTATSRPQPKRVRAGKPRKSKPYHFGNKQPASARLFDAGAHQPYVQPGGDIDIPIAERKSLLDLTETSCRWPIGDPRMADFHFCNRDKVPGLPYCEFHARRAFQPPQPHQRQVSNEIRVSAVEPPVSEEV